MKALPIPFENIPFESFQKRLRSGELRAPQLNDQNCQLFGLPSQLVCREAYIADRESTLEDLAVPTFHYRGGRKGQR